MSISTQSSLLPVGKEPGMLAPDIKGLALHQNLFQTFKLSALKVISEIVIQFDLKIIINIIEDYDYYITRG